MSNLFDLEIENYSLTELKHLMGFDVNDKLNDSILNEAGKLLTEKIINMKKVNKNKKKQIIMFVKKAKEKIRIHNELQMNKRVLNEIRENQKTIDKKLTLILERLTK